MAVAATNPRRALEKAEALCGDGRTYARLESISEAEFGTAVTRIHRGLAPLTSDPLFLVIENQTDAPVMVYWVNNYNGLPKQLFPELPPDGRITLQSFRDHLWFVEVDGRARSSWMLSGDSPRLMMPIR